MQTYKMTRCCFALTLSLFLSALLGSSLSMAQSPQSISIYGSNTIGSQLLPALAKSFLESQNFTTIQVQNNPELLQHKITASRNATQPSVRIEIHSQGSSTGFSALHNQSADLAAASRPIKDHEAELFRSISDMRSKESEHILAIDGVAIIVHPLNPIKTLSTEQLAAIFSGSIRNWEALGGQQGEINIYARDHNSGTWETFKELVLADAGLSLASTAKRFESSQALSETVSQDPNGIGFIGLPYVLKAKAVAISAGDSAAMLPSAKLIATEDYPLSRRLYLYSTGQSQNALVNQFIAFAHSDAGQQQVEALGFISQIVKAMPVPSDASMPMPYQHLTQHAQRLSVNFRFKEGSAQLDNKALRDIDRVLAYLRKQQKTNKQLVLVGFGDTKSDPQRALLLSKLRAMAVRRELRKDNIILREVLGIGDAMPVASNQMDQGRLKNRRVELWVY